jgi:antitoxin component YwqK of YwqJK toxin-antitoxin module
MNIAEKVGLNPMKTLAFLSVGVLFILCGCSKNEKSFSGDYKLENLVVNYNEDSTQVISYGLIDKKGEQGEWTFFDTSGKIEKIETYKDGVLNGRVVLFLCCQKFSTYEYEDGILEGEIIYYSSEGDISSKGYFKNGKLNGIWADFIDGEILSIQLYNNDQSIFEYLNEKNKDAIIGNEFFGCCERH